MYCSASRSALGLIRFMRQTIGILLFLGFWEMIWNALIYRYNRSIIFSLQVNIIDCAIVESRLEDIWLCILESFDFIDRIVQQTSVVVLISQHDLTDLVPWGSRTQLPVMEEPISFLVRQHFDSWNRRWMISSWLKISETRSTCMLRGNADSLTHHGHVSGLLDSR